MDNGGRGRRLLAMAAEYLHDMDAATGRKSWNAVVRRAQEVALKGVLSYLGVDFPKAHDPAAVFIATLSTRGMALSATEAEDAATSRPHWRASGRRRSISSRSRISRRPRRPRPMRIASTGSACGLSPPSSRNSRNRLSRPPSERRPRGSPDRPPKVDGQQQYAEACRAVECLPPWRGGERSGRQ